MGTDKALLRLGSLTFLQRLAELLHPHVDPLLIVLGHHASEIQAHLVLPPGSRIVVNPHYQRGQLSSLQAALRALQEFPVRAALVTLVDHPAVSAPTIGSILDTFDSTRAAVVIPTFQGRRGHPVVFSSRLFPDLLASPLDQGARTVIRQQEQTAAVEFVETEDEGILLDIDRPEDYAALATRWK